MEYIWLIFHFSKVYFQRHAKLHEWLLSVTKKILNFFLRVALIYNIEDPQFLSNYCHISVLSVFSRLFEKCMHSLLYAFLTKYELLCKKQFGFRNNHCRSHTLISLVDLIKKYVGNNYFVCGFFVNLHEIFDTVNHEIHLVKLDFVVSVD